MESQHEFMMQEMTARYEAGKAEAYASLQAQQAAAADAQAAITHSAEAKLNKLQLQVSQAFPLFNLNILSLAFYCK